MIEAKDAEKAIQWMVDNARKMAQDRANRLYMEQWIKTQKATIQNEQMGLSAAAAESIALADKRYLDALNAYKEAIERDEYNRFLLTAAEAKADTYRTQEATRRAEIRGTT